jgi:hypothetical protein
LESKWTNHVSGPLNRRLDIVEAKLAERDREIAALKEQLRLQEEQYTRSMSLVSAESVHLARTTCESFCKDQTSLLQDAVQRIDQWVAREDFGASDGVPVREFLATCKDSLVVASERAKKQVERLESFASESELLKDREARMARIQTLERRVDEMAEATKVKGEMQQVCSILLPHPLAYEHNASLFIKYMNENISRTQSMHS